LCTLTQALDYSLSVSASGPAAVRLRERHLRLASVAWGQDLKEELYRVLVFSNRLFPTFFRSFADRVRTESNKEHTWLLFESLSKRAPAAQAQPKAQASAQPGVEV
jgi:hypothetical protein